MRANESIFMLALCTSLTACGADGASPGTVRITLSGEDASREGFPVGSGEERIAFADGFKLQFDKVIVSIVDFELTDSDGERADLNPDPVIADLHLGEPEAWVFEGVPARRWNNVSYRYGAPTAASRNINGVAAADIENMIANGYAFWIEGTATDGEERFPFQLGFAFDVDNRLCVNGIDETDGMVVADNSIVEAQLTIHLDHLWFDTYAEEEARLRFEAWAAWRGDDGVITLETLAKQSLSDLRDRKGDPLAGDDGSRVIYDPGNLVLSSNDLAKYVLAAAATTGHFNGEGHCDYVTAN